MNTVWAALLMGMYLFISIILASVWKYFVGDE